MIITRRKQPSLPVTPLKIKQTFLERVHSYRYLGVWLTSSLNWSKQVSEVCKKARQQVGILYRKFYPFANSSSLLQLYIPGLHPTTSGIRYTCMGPPPTGTYQLPGEFRNLHLRCALKTGVLDMSLCFSHATCLPLPAEDAI